jgi:CheY-like chemotaxis protein
MPKREEPKKKICIVEDDDSIREIYKTALEGKGYEVTTAADGEEGLRALKFNRPDVVLLDLLMPKMDGVSLMKVIRGDRELADLPVIVMTNVDDQDVVKKVGKYNASFYLVKSLFDPKKMVGIVEEVLFGK